VPFTDRLSKPYQLKKIQTQKYIQSKQERKFVGGIMYRTLKKFEMMYVETLIFIAYFTEVKLGQNILVLSSE